MRVYRGIFVSKSSDLNDALEKDQTVPENVANVKKIFSGTTDRFQAIYQKNDDWKWFMSKHNKILHQINQPLLPQE